MFRVRKQLNIENSIQNKNMERKDNGSPIEDENGVAAAVLDTGVSLHPDLYGKVVAFRDFVNNKEKQYDDNGHGTHVAGIICGSGIMSNGIYQGISPKSKLIVGKVLDENGEGSFLKLTEALKWINEICEMYKIRILNISIGFHNDNKDSVDEVISYMKDLWEKGVLIICAAGNNGPDSMILSNIKELNTILTVGCNDGEHYKNCNNRCELYSERGVDLVAPGTNIVSCCNKFHQNRYNYSNSYCAMSGTSMATAIVSGIAAELMRKYPELSNEECKMRLEYSAKNLGLPREQQGWGMVDYANLIKSF